MSNLKDRGIATVKHGQFTLPYQNIPFFAFQKNVFSLPTQSVLLSKMPKTEFSEDRMQVSRSLPHTLLSQAYYLSLSLSLSLCVIHSTNKLISLSFFIFLCLRSYKIQIDRMCNCNPFLLSPEIHFRCRYLLQVGGGRKPNSTKERLLTQVVAQGTR